MATLAIGMALAAAGTTATTAGVAMTLAAMVADQIMAQGLVRMIASTRTGPKMPGELRLNGGQGGAPIPRIYGHMRTTGTVVWLDEPRLLSRLVESNLDGKRTPKFVEKNYWAANLMIVFGEVGVPSLTLSASQQGEDDDEAAVEVQRESMVAMPRIWADAQLIYDLRPYHEPVGGDLGISFFLGEESQSSPTVIETASGESEPGYRGVAGILLEDFDLSQFGNRLPQFEAELYADLAPVACEEGVEGMATGRDGVLYVCCHTGRTVAAIDPVKFERLAQIGRGSDYLGEFKAHPWRCAADGQGSVWVTCKGDAALARIDEASLAIAEHIDIGRYPECVACDDGGHAWVTHPTLDQLSRVDASTKGVTTYAVTGQPWDIIFAVGALWVTCSTTVKRIDPATGMVIADIPLLASSSSIYSAFFPWGIDYEPISGEIICAIAGMDTYARIAPDRNEMIDTRNAGTLPQSVATAKTETAYGYAAISTTAGNRITAYSPETAKGLEIAAISFPGQIQEMASDQILAIANSKLDVIQLARLHQGVG